jgi:hypothetical protein
MAPRRRARRRAARVSVRVQEAAGGAAVVLLRGLPASGTASGAAFDGVEGQLVVPGLLDFGRSRLPAGVPVDREAHLARWTRW